ncbi:MAG: phenylalanine 4-monooxygenase, partial [Bryobacteraceae bacterium]
MFIEQAYDLYSPEDHRSWSLLFARLQPRWRRYACDRFREGLAALHLDPDRIPRLDDVNKFLGPLTGFRARAVSGYVAPLVFFECLRRREFPTTIAIRPADRLDYLPEPDIFHDICGHVPMHTDPAFAATLVRLGECARAASEIGDAGARESVLRGMARFFWFTIEFGLMRGPAGLRAYGSGLLSSLGEIEHAVDSPRVDRRPIDLERVVNEPFRIDE